MRIADTHYCDYCSAPFAVENLQRLGRFECCQLCAIWPNVTKEPASDGDDGLYGADQCPIGQGMRGPKPGGER